MHTHIILKHGIQFLFLISLVSLSACAQGQGDTTNTASETTGEAEKPKPKVQDIGPERFKELVSSGSGIVLDVRTPGEVAQGTIGQASVIDIYDPDFEKKINLMDKTKPIYVYCKSGGRSSSAANKLIKNGFAQVYNLQGGVMAWEASGFSLTNAQAIEDHGIQTLSMDDFREVLATEKPVLVDFHTVWCAPCRRMAPIVDQLEADYQGRATVLRVDVDKSKDIAKEYAISGVPVFMLFVQGKAVWQHSGTLTREALMAQLDSHL
ncbi:MAG: thioredoxin family protein [Bacteroidetes bacterium]|nr:thioredoxin family protein [Bacteroidota bacterium]